MNNVSIIPFLNQVSAAILNPLIFILFSVSFVYFAIGVVRLITADAGKKQEGKNAVIWGLVGMFIMFCTYGIIALLLDSFGIQKSTVPYINSRL